MRGRNVDFYQQLRAKISGWVKRHGRKHRYAEYVLVAPDLFHLLCRLSVDKRVPASEKAKLAAAIAYFVSPMDLIPEGFVGPVGYVDDVAVAALVLNAIVNKTSPTLVRSHWAGDGDVLELVKRILDVADEMVGSGLWATLRGIVGGRARSGDARKHSGHRRTGSRSR